MSVKIDEKKLIQEKPKLKGQEVRNHELEVCKQQVDEWKNKYLRALADYQNFEKRIQGEKKQWIRSANKQLILKLLPFLDNLDKAEIFVKDNGLKMVKDHFCQMLKQENIEELNVLGKEFDPHTAEVVDLVKGEKENIVVEVIRKGYRFYDTILRVAQVKVSKKVNN
jgi:molecular chaperone GrpE